MIPWPGITRASRAKRPLYSASGPSLLTTCAHTRRTSHAARPNASNARACLPIIQLKFTSECFDGAPSLRREAEVAAAQQHTSRHDGPHSTGSTSVHLSAERHNRFFWAAETPSWSTCADDRKGARSGRQHASTSSAKNQRSKKASQQPPRRLPRGERAHSSRSHPHRAGEDQ